MILALACPIKRDLERFALGQLPETDAEQLCQHILACSSCAGLLDSLQGAHPLAAELRGLGAFLPAVSSADALVERLVHTDHTSHDVLSAATETPGPPRGQQPPPESLGRYRISGRLGAGGMGVVYRGHDPRLGRDVAVKLPNFRGSDEEAAAARERFLREARAAAAVRHAHVCPIYDVGEEQGRPYVVMALVEGETLDGRLRRQGRFEDAREAVDLLLRVADALAAVHAGDIVHRDLKPANILLDRAGQPFLTDFGLARATGGEQLTLDGQLVGTPAYMAPEQASSELGTVGPRSDQYSLGVVLYEMLTGRRPFEGMPSELVFQLGTKTVPPPSKHRPELDRKLESLLLKALARRPPDRYASVVEFAAALRGWKDRLPRPTTGTLAAQQRRVTLLSCGCDLFDSPAILETLDPEEQHELLLAFQQLCRDVAAQLEGTVVKETDQGILICFGYPHVLESPARRAVRGSLRLLERMSELNERLAQQHEGLHLCVRIAVHCDVAVVTQSGGPGETLSIVGQVLPVVNQLAHLADADTVVISDPIHALVKGFFECESLGAHKLGASGSMAVHRVHRQLPVYNRVDVAVPAGLTPLIGRDREAALLEGRWDQAAEGFDHVVQLVGEAGIGKSRMVRVLKEHALAQTAPGSAALIVEWPCRAHTQTCCFFLAREYFQRLLNLRLHDSPADQLSKVANHLEELHLASDEHIYLLASMLSIPLDQRYPNPGWSPQRQKEKTFDLLLDWLRALAEHQPVLFVIEDLHWAASNTLEFVDLLVGQPLGERVLTVLTWRPEFQPAWKSRAHHTQVSLDPLTRRQVSDLLIGKTGCSKLPENIVNLIAQRSDGIPLFVEEFAATLAAHLCNCDDGPQLASHVDEHFIPATLHDLLLSRLERATGNFEIVQLAATIGREFSYELLAAAAPWSEEVLEQELEKLVQAELLFVRGRLPQARYQFKHALIQDSAYQSLLKKRRQQFHLRIAEALEQRFPETCAAQPELLAHHFTEGAAISKGVTYWTRAGERKQQRGAPEEAAAYFTRGLELIGSLPESPERHSQEIPLLVGLGVVLAATQGFGVPQSEEIYARAHALCLQSGVATQVFPAMFGQLRVCMNRALHARAQELAEEMLELAQRQANPAFIIAAQGALGLSLLYQGKYTAARTHLERVIAVEPTPELRQTVHRFVLVDPWVSAHTNLSWISWLLGYPDRAAEHRRQALRMAEQLGHAFSIGLALCDESLFYWFTRDGEKLLATTTRALALGVEKGFASLVAWARIVDASSSTESAQSEQALSTIRQGLEELRLQSALADRNTMLPLLAEACARAGRPGEGLQALNEACQFADAHGERYFQKDTLRLQGELLLEHDPTAVQQAEACFHQALDVAHRQQARSLELRAAISLARLWIGQDQMARAHELLAPLYRRFTEGFQTHDLRQAKALLDQCSESGRI